MKYDVFVKDKIQTQKCTEDKNLMDSLYVFKDLVPKACHNGACGLCKIKVHKGFFIKDKMNRKHISQEEENDNILLACKVFPKCDMEIEFISKKNDSILNLRRAK
ncbi:[2Fe-2S] iron-sulfur cluster binding domain-containing protein [Aliarcobacter faecis]|uniref:2Fe-2S iron-sulfur cluster-binding protein n=1 Tax=Aliarcobacter faecis TaxID=1564138 RepID=UPI0004B4E04D|nr:2Fe-2S iron-sulfur cluster binding domain-containing protein [Aliarcobacter faecis]QKF74002.1 [2Fe-2S] iron-sulfur cluster binding domain-containing protein [Aliarcobacter faecis]